MNKITKTLKSKSQVREKIPKKETQGTTTDDLPPISLDSSISVIENLSQDDDEETLSFRGCTANLWSKIDLIPEESGNLTKPTSEEKFTPHSNISSMQMIELRRESNILSGQTEITN